MSKFVFAIGTKSALKIRAVEAALSQLEQRGITQLGDLHFSPWEIRASETDSKIPAQPFGHEQMFTGALNRARAARVAHGAEIGIGIENGLVNISPEDGRHCWFDLSAIAIVYPRCQIMGLSLGAALPVPYDMVREVREQQSELGSVIQKRAGGGEKDPLKYLSKNVLDRESAITQAVLCAFAPIISADEYRM
jgi:inosine/xanthosine triphosphatase